MEAITREEKIMSGENLTPITRKEMFLAKAAGQDVETPEPITREEMFLSQISSNSGDGGSEDWYITDARYLFYNGARLDAKDNLISKMKDVTNTSYMFNNCYNLTGLDVSNFDTSKVTDTTGMFTGCRNLTSLDVSKWDTSKVTSMGGMFNNCSKLTSLDVGNFDTSNVTNMTYMFDSCRALEEIVGFSATNEAGLNIGFPKGKSSSPSKLKRLTFRTDLASGVYSIRSAINISYCSFERDGMVEMFNTLPDVSGLGLPSSNTTITITGNPCLSDLTAEDEAIATSKGWTLVK